MAIVGLSKGEQTTREDTAMAQGKKGGKKAGPKVKTGQKGGGTQPHQHNLTLIRA
jgi:hypothetical protein